jgi:hypothetical protein
MKITMFILAASIVLAGAGAPAAWSQTGIQKGPAAGWNEQAPRVVWTEPEQRRFWSENEDRGG